MVYFEAFYILVLKFVVIYCIFFLRQNYSNVMYYHLKENDFFCVFNYINLKLQVFVVNEYSYDFLNYDKGNNEMQVKSQ